MAPAKHKEQQLLLLNADAIEVLPLKNPRLANGSYGGHRNHHKADYNSRLEPAPPRLFSCNSEPFLPMYETTPLFEPSPPESPSVGPEGTPTVSVVQNHHPQSSGPHVQPRPRKFVRHETERERKRMTLVVGICATSIFVTAFLLVAITLRMTPQIDEMIRKETEQELLKMMQSPGSANDVHNNSSATNSSSTTTSTHNPNEG